MKKIKLLLAAVALMLGGSAWAQTDAEYAAANAAIEANGVYKIYTLSDGTSIGSTKYYLKADGYLTDDASAAGQFTFDFQRSFGNFKMGAYRLNRFTNGGNSNSSSTLSADAQKHIIVSTSQNRVNWEAQVFFKNEDGYAIRSTNSTGTAWGASAFWSVVEDNDEDGLPNATYTFDNPAPFVWQLEQVTAGDYSDVTAKWITNYEPNTKAKEEGWTVTPGTKMGDWDGHNFADNVAEFYRRSGGGIAQTVNELPAGYYTFTAIASARSGSGGTISANGISKGIVALNINSTSEANTQFTSGYGVNTIDFVLEEPSNVTFAITAGTASDAWTVYRCFYLTYSSGPTALRKSLATIKESANTALNNEAYASVTGYERTQLQASVAKTITETGAPSIVQAAYTALIEEITQNLSAFTSAPQYYTLLEAENTRAAWFEIAAQTTESQSALAALDAQAKAVYNHVTTNYNTIIDLGEWTKENAGNMTSQHWDGTSTSSYNEQLEGWGGSTAWTTSYSQDIVLPAGDYVFKVAGRHSQYSTLELVVKKGDKLLGSVNDFPVGDTGRGIATDGTASFGDDATYANGGVGRGWQWRYVPFTIEEENATITISVEGGNPEEKQYQWLGFCNYTVQSAPSVAASTVAYNQAKETAVAARDNDTYVNVQGTDRSGLVAAIEADKGTTIESIDAAAEALKAATTTFTAAKASWDKLVSTRAGVSSELPYASSEKKSELDAAVVAEVTGNAANADAQVAVIEQKNRLYVESNAMAEGFVGAENKTSLITNPNADENADGWSGGFGRLSGEAFTQGDGTSAGGYFDKNGASSYTAEQTIENLAAGKYLLTITARAQSGVTDYKVKATNSTSEVATGDVTVVGNQGGVFGRGFNDASVEFLQKVAGNATIGITAEHSSNFWLSFDRVRLVRLRDLTPEEAFVPATDEDYALLNGNLAKYVLGFEAGEFAPYNNSTLVQAIAAAKAIDQDAANAQEDVQAAANAITSAGAVANETEVNAIYNGDFAIAAHDGASNPQPIGWYRNEGSYTGDGTNVRYVSIPSGVEGNTSAKGLFGKFTMKYGAETGYSLPLKQGFYKLTFSYGGWNEKGARDVQLYNEENTATVEISTVTAANNTAHTTASSWRAYSSLITVPAAGDYTLSFYRQNTTSQNQIVLTDIVLVKATAADFKVALAAEIETASALYNNGANVGAGAFQIPAADGTAMSDAVSAAQTVYDNTDATIEEVIAATESVTAAVEAYKNVELNAPATGKVYNIINVSDGYDHNGKAVTCKAASDADLSKNTTSFGYNETPGSIFPQGFTFTAVDGQKNVYKLSYTRADGQVVYVGTGSSTGLGSNNDQIRPTTDASKAVDIRVDATSTENVWNLYNTLASKNIGANGKSDQGFYTVNSYNKMKIQEAEENEVALTIKAENQYGTLIIPFASEVPSGVIVYSIESISGEELNLDKVDAIAANTPYVVYAASGIDETLSGMGSAYTDATYTDANNLLTGAYSQITAPVGRYVLQNGDEGIGFYRVAEGTINVPANRAYLTTTAGVKAFFFNGGDADGIKSVFDGIAAGKIFDLSGRKVAKMQKGNTYIVNGKKVNVK